MLRHSIVDGYIPSIHVDLMDIAMEEFEGRGEVVLEDVEEGPPGPIWRRGKGWWRDHSISDTQGL